MSETPHDTGDIRRIVAPQSHEYTANWNYQEHGLRPWFALDSVVKDSGGSAEQEIEAAGETWSATLYYQEGGLLPPSGGETPAGTHVQHDTIREFRISCVAQDDVRERKANFHIRPRWKGLTAENDDGEEIEIPVPDELANHRTDAVNVRISGSNIRFDDYTDLLQSAMESFGISPHYFKNEHRHPTSNIQDAARYVRIHKHQSGPVHARTGPLVSLAHVLENDRDGYRKLVQNDSDERGRTVPGYYHTATLGPERVQEVFPNHELPVECKHYFAREAYDRPLDDPLAHPKLEVAYQVSRWNDTLRPADHDQLEQELDEWLYAILSDAGLDLRAGNTYVQDAYFKNSNDTTTANIVSLDLTTVRHEQESIVYKHLAGGMSPVERETLNTLVSDGGQVSPSKIATENDRHQDSVYSALQRMNDLVEHEYNSVSLKSTYLSELVADALDQAKESLARATNAAAETMHSAGRGLDDRTSAFIAWAERYGVNYRSGDSDTMRIDIGEIETVQVAKRIIRQGYRLWTELKKDPSTFRSAQVRYVNQGVRKETKPAYVEAWRLL